MLIKYMSINSILKRSVIKYMYMSNMGFDAKKYWKCRDIAMNNSKNKLFRIISLHYVSKINVKFCANIYTGLDTGCIFETPPILPHQLNGIFIASTAHIGKNVTILQQVTIGGNPATFDGSSPVSKAATIGDNVIIGTGAKIIGNVNIGNNVVIGANAVVVSDIPDNMIAVGVPAIYKERKRK